MGRFLRALLVSAISILFVLAATWHVTLAPAHAANAKFDPAVRPEFREPVTLASKDGVLEVTVPKVETAKPKKIEVKAA